MKLLAIIQLTFRESFAKKTFMAFFGISTLTCLLFLFALNLDIVDGFNASVSIFGQDLPESLDLSKIIIGIEGALAVLLFTGGIFMSLFATSSLIPAMLQPGFIDIFISKPLHRITILFGRYLGALAIVAFNIFYLVIFAGLIISLKSGIWNWGFLWAAVIIVITFAALFSLMTFLGVISRSGPFSLMLTYLILFFSPLLLQRNEIYALLSSRVYGYILDGLYYFLPKTAELGNMTQQLVRGLSVTNWMPLWTGLLFTGFMFILSGYLFLKKNF